MCLVPGSLKSCMAAHHDVWCCFSAPSENHEFTVNFGFTEVLVLIKIRLKWKPHVQILASNSQLTSTGIAESVID